MPACLPWKEGDTGREVEPGQVALVAGWGRTSNNRSEAKENYDQGGNSIDILNFGRLFLAMDIQAAPNGMGNDPFVDFPVEWALLALHSSFLGSSPCPKIPTIGHEWGS